MTWCRGAVTTNFLWPLDIAENNFSLCEHAEVFLSSAHKKLSNFPAIMYEGVNFKVKKAFSHSSDLIGIEGSQWRWRQRGINHVQHKRKFNHYERETFPS